MGLSSILIISGLLHQLKTRTPKPRAPEHKNIDAEIASSSTDHSHNRAKLTEEIGEIFVYTFLFENDRFRSPPFLLE